MAELARAVFLDRDGVLVEDRGALTSTDHIRVLPGAASALRALHDAGWALVVVTNQPAVARGLLSTSEVWSLQHAIERELHDAGAPALDGFYFCPHHPRANLAAYRKSCDCRKPSAGMISEACQALGLDPSASVMVGDRPSDIAAGARAGCRTVWVQTGRHADPPIEVEGGFSTPAADHTCADLSAAARWILEGAT